MPNILSRAKPEEIAVKQNPSQPTNVEITHIPTGATFRVFGNTVYWKSNAAANFDKLRQCPDLTTVRDIVKTLRKSR